MTQDELQSRTIDFLKFPLIVLVVFIHSYTSVRMLPDMNEGHPLYHSVTYIFSLELGEICVPLFFFISGFLFFWNSDWQPTTYKKKIHNRVKSLLIPYLFWNIIIIGMYYFAQHISGISDIFSGSNKLISNYNGLDFLAAFWDRGAWEHGNGTPILCQMWFVRNLFILCLLTPLIRLYIRYLKYIGIVLLLITWYFTPGQGFLISSLCFFTAGAYFSVNNLNFITIFRKHYLILTILYLCFAIADFLLRGVPYHLYIHRLEIFLGISFTFICVSYYLENGKFHTVSLLTQASFFIFIIHDPLLTLTRRGILKLFPSSNDWIILLQYFLIPVSIILTGLFIYDLLRRYLPGFLHFSTGR